MSESRYSRIRERKLPRRQRWKSEKGANDDDGSWVKCPMCGFVNEVSQLRPSDRYGIEIYDKPFENLDRALSGDPLNITAVLDKIDQVGVALENGPYGTAITSYYSPRASRGVAGCAFCGNAYP